MDVMHGRVRDDVTKADVGTTYMLRGLQLCEPVVPLQLMQGRDTMRGWRSRCR